MRLLIILSVFSFALLSCKKEGCTDPLAINTNQEANKDDGSCIYRTTCIIDKIRTAKIDSGYNTQQDTLFGIVYRGDTTFATYKETMSTWYGSGSGWLSLFNSGGYGYHEVYELDNPVTIGVLEAADSITFIRSNPYHYKTGIPRNEAPFWYENPSSYTSPQPHILEWLD